MEDYNAFFDNYLDALISEVQQVRRINRSNPDFLAVVAAIQTRVAGVTETWTDDWNDETGSDEDWNDDGPDPSECWHCGGDVTDNHCSSGGQYS